MASDEPPWELFSSDLKTSRMVIRRPHPSLPFDIPILSKPSRYQAPSGPCEQRVDLQLVHDTDAFIIHKLVLPLGPFLPRGDPRQRRVFYIIGWPDLPAARPVVDATRILDYVSPRTLEDWEYQEARRVEYELRQAAQDARLAAEYNGAATTAAAAGSSELLRAAKKKPGRKPKNPKVVQARMPTPQLDSEQEAQLASRKNVPSLSTPQKNRIAQLDAEMALLGDMDDEMDISQNDEDLIQQQLTSEAQAASDDHAMSTSVDMRVLGSQQGSAVAPTHQTWPGELFPPSPALESESSSRASSASEVAPPFSPYKSSPPILTKKEKTPVVKATGRPPQAGRQIPISTTPIPLPPRVAFGTRAHTSSPAQQPKPLPARMTARQTQDHRPVLGPETSKYDTQQEHISSEGPPRNPVTNGGFTPTNAFTPVGESIPRPLKRPAESPTQGEAEPRNTPSSAKPKSHRKKKAPKVSSRSPSLKPEMPAAAPAPDQQEWVVKRLEGHDIVDGIHYFKVRWEGDWPPDQNPTWEPEENITPGLVKRYLKHEAEKGKKTPASKPKPSRQQSTLSHWVTGYSSVSEAFEGRAELDDTSTKPHAGDFGLDGAASGDDGDEEELLVVEEARDAERGRAADERMRTLGAQVAAQFASMTPIRRDPF